MSAAGCMLPVSTCSCTQLGCPAWTRPTLACAGARAGQGRLLPRDEPSIWYEAAAAIAAPEAPVGPPASEAQRAQLQADAEASLQAEANAFERDLGE